jgi:hypothetical protein
MNQPLARDLVRDVEEAADDVRHSLRKVGGRIAGHAPRAVAEAAHRLSVASHALVRETRGRARLLGAGAARQARARPVATVATVGLIGVALTLAAFAAMGRRRTTGRD